MAFITLLHKHRSKPEMDGIFFFSQGQGYAAESFLSKRYIKTQINFVVQDTETLKKLLILPSTSLWENP